MAADRPYGEFYDFYSVSPEYFEFTLVREFGSLPVLAVRIEICTSSASFRAKSGIALLLKLRPLPSIFTVSQIIYHRSQMVCDIGSILK
jgi:hypothetical protein